MKFSSLREISPRLFLKIIKVILAIIIFNFTLLILNLNEVYAQTIDPSSWQNSATGLRISSNPDKKTAGLVWTMQASGIPFLNLQGGFTDGGWQRLTDHPIEMGEIKVSGTTPSLTSESADWAHNEMTFSNNLKFWVSRLSPALLIQNSNTSLRLFSGNLTGTTITQGPAWNPNQVTNRAAAPSFPKYVAYSSGGSLRIQTIPASNTSALSLPTLDNNWILVWYGGNSYFVETKTPATYIVPHSDAYQADAPILLKFQNNPTSISQTSEGGIDLTFNGNSDYTSMLPLFGREHLKATDTEGWGSSGSLPTNVLTKINFWNTNNRLCSYPTTVSETYAYDTNTDTATISENITYLNVCNGGSATQSFAILPPTVSLAKDALETSFNVSGTLTDANYPTEFGPIIGIDNTNHYSYSVSGLKKYTDTKRVLTNPNGAPSDLVQKLTDQIDKTIQAGHYLPWIYPQHLPEAETMDDIYYLNEADVIYQLSEVAQALPDSSDPQAPKNRLLEYIKSERTNPNYQPETVYNLPNTGTQRTPHAIENLDPASWDLRINTFQYLQNNNKQLFLKRVPLYNFYALAKYYELPGTEAIPNSVVAAAKDALKRDMAEQDWASFSWFRGFNVGIWSGHVTLNDVNRLLDGLIGFTKLAKKTNDTQEGLGRTLLAKAAIQRIAMAKYPRYLYASGLQSLPSDPDWMPKYTASQWEGFIWNYNWRQSYDDARVIAWQDQFGTALSGASNFNPPSPLLDIRDYEYLQNAYLSAYKDMAPETFRLATDFAKQDLEVNLNKVTRLMPHWYMPYAEDFIGGEHGTTYPINSYQLFMAKTFVQNDTPDNLRKYASFSWLDSGDFFYMQKLAETIKAYEGVAWEDQTYLTTDVNQDYVVDLKDLQILFDNWNSPRDRRTDVNSDGIVNGVDFALVLKDWGKTK